MNEFDSQISRLQCNLEDNGNLKDSIYEALIHSLEYDIYYTEWNTIESPKIQAWKDIENLVDCYGSPKTKLLYRTLLNLDNIRKPLGEAISLLKRVNSMNDD